MNSNPRVKEPFPLNKDGTGAVLTVGWTTWFNEVQRRTDGFGASLSISAMVNFGTVPMQDQKPGSMSMKGVRPTDRLLITPAADANGLFFSAVITADDVVTIYAKNFTTDAITPPPIEFHVTAFQN